MIRAGASARRAASSTTGSHRPLSARRSGPLKGRVRVPGDKSISHRALIFGALAVGETRISGLLEGEDVLNTGKAMRALGASVERTGEGAWRVHGVGVGGFRDPAGVLDFGNSGTGCGWSWARSAGCPITATFDGDASLRKRPMKRILDPVALIGARAVSEPATAAGCRSRSPARATRSRSSTARRCRRRRSSRRCCSRRWPRPGTTTVIESEASRDHTERLLTHFGAEVTVEPEGEHGRKITLTGEPELVPAPVVVPADPSSAAFPMVAALIVPGSEVILTDVMTNPLRTGLITTLREMGADDRDAQRARRRRRGDGRFPRARSGAARRRRAGRARALDDRRISDPGGGGGLRRGHDADARPQGAAGEGIRPPRRGRRRACAPTASRSRSTATT